MKNKKNGFMISEALIVSTFMCAVLVYIFIQLKTVNKNYNKTFKYNNIRSLYKTNEVAQYLKEIDLETLKDEFDSSSFPFLDLTICSNNYIKEVDYCESLFTDLRIYKVFFIQNDISSFLTYFNNNVVEYEKTDLISFLKTINYKAVNDKYRLIIWYANNTFATISLE